MHNSSAGSLCRVSALAAAELILLTGAGMGLALGFVLGAALITQGWFCSC